MAIGILVFALIGIIGVYIFQNVYTALPTLTGDANTSVEAYATNFFSGMNLLGVGIIVFAAVTIIMIIGMLQSKSA